MGRVFDEMVAFFEGDGWNFAPVEDHEDALMMGFEVDDHEWACFSQAREEQEQVTFYSVLPFRIEDAQRVDAMTFVTLANYGLILGNFELDLADGEIRFKTSVDVEGSVLTPDLMRPVVQANIAMMRRYFGGFEALVAGTATAAEAVAACEAD